MLTRKHGHAMVTMLNGWTNFAAVWCKANLLLLPLLAAMDTQLSSALPPPQVAAVGKAAAAVWRW
jgi:hypothetical protein